MKPKAFDYHAPATVDDALALLGGHNGDARVLAGGQTLLPMMNFRLATPEVLVDLNRIPDLAYIRAEDDEVRIGAMTRQRALEFSPAVAVKLPLLQAVMKLVGHLPTRSRGTIGGSLANADPAAELPMALQVLNGRVQARGPNGERVIPADALVVDAMTTSLAEDEIITEIRFPAMAPTARFAVEEFSRRHGDFAVAAVAAVLVIEDGRCRSARLATAGVSARSTRMTTAEQLLQGQAITPDVIARAAEAAAATVDPIDDRNASGAFRRHLTQVLAARALARAMRNADPAVVATAQQH